MGGWWLVATTDLLLRVLGRSCSAEHDHGTGREDLWASAPTASDAIDDGLEVVEIADANTRQGVRIAGEGEGLDDLREVGHGRIDFGNLGSGREAKFDERFDLVPCHLVVDKHGVTTDQTDLLQAVNPTFRSGRREPHEPTDLAGGLTGVGSQSVENGLVGCVDRDRGHIQIVTQNQEKLFDLIVFLAVNDERLDQSPVSYHDRGVALPSEPIELATLEAVQDRVLWLATSIIHHANKVRKTSSGVKVGGHQASSASMVSIMTALWFEHLRAEDRVSVKPHASPVLHAIEYLLGQLDAEYLKTLRQFGGLQSYPSRLKDPVPADFSTGSVGIGATAPIWSAVAHRYVAGHFDVPRGGRRGGVARRR